VAIPALVAKLGVRQSRECGLGLQIQDPRIGRGTLDGPDFGTIQVHGCQEPSPGTTLGASLAPSTRRQVAVGRSRGSVTGDLTSGVRLHYRDGMRHLVGEFPRSRQDLNFRRVLDSRFEPQSSTKVRMNPVADWLRARRTE